MQTQESIRILSYLQKAQPAGEILCGSIVNGISALFMSDDVVSKNFRTKLCKWMNESAQQILSESVGSTNVLNVPTQGQNQKSMAEVMMEQIVNSADRLL